MILKNDQIDQGVDGNTAPGPDTPVQPPTSEKPSEEAGAGAPPQPEGQATDQISGSTQMSNLDEQVSGPEGQYNNGGFEMNQSGFPSMGWGDGSTYNQMAQFMPNGMPQPGMGQFQNSMGNYAVHL